MSRLESTEWIEAGEYKEAMSDLFAHIDALEQAAAERVITDGSRGPTPDHAGEGSAWVPPTPVTDATLVEVRSWIHAVGPVGAMVWVDPQEVLKVAGVRVLGDGMAAVDREEWAATQDLLAQARCAAHAVEDDGQCDMTGICRAVFACDSLRANKGGTTHD